MYSISQPNNLDSNFPALPRVSTTHCPQLPHTAKSVKSIFKYNRGIFIYF